MNSKIFSVLFIVLFSASSALAKASENVSASSDRENGTVIKVNNISISESEFQSIFGAAVKHKYYHGRVPKEELEVFRKEVANDLVDQILVHSEAIATGVEADLVEIQKAVDAYDARYAESPEWQSQREKVLPLMIERLERENLIEKMKARVKDIAQPKESQVREYYLANKEKFTEPKRVWVSLILITVPPSSSGEVWEEAFKTAEKVIELYENGDEFSDLVEAYSGHISVENAGDLGYLHQGMLDASAQEAVESLAVNEISGPVNLLEGVALFRLNGIRESSLKPFDEVNKRATSLLYRELQDNAWSEYVNGLKHSADIFVDKELTVLTSHE